MRSFWNCLGEPSLHLLASAVIVAYLAFGRGPRIEEAGAESPLPTCKACHGHFLPGKGCGCQAARGIAHALP